MLAEVSPTHAQYTKVILNIDEEHSFEAGDESGRTLELICPWGTQAMAQNILVSLRGYQYVPYTADSAILNPAAELGDGVTVTGAASGIFSRTLRFNNAMFADIAAPQGNDIDHEFPYQSKGDRTVQRQISQVKATLRVNAQDIEARVEKTGGVSTSFGWKLDASSHVWTADGAEVMRVDKNGLTVKGKVIATSGNIGGCEIENGMLKIGSANITSINADYINVGTLNVDRLEKKAITSEHVADYGIGGGSIASDTIGNRSLMQGSIFNSTLAGGCISNDKLNSALQDAIAEALYAKKVFAGNVLASYTKANYLDARTRFYFQSKTAEWVATGSISSKHYVLCAN